MKKALSLALALALMFSLCACDDWITSNIPSQESTTTTESTEQTTTTEESTTTESSVTEPTTTASTTVTKTTTSTTTEPTTTTTKKKTTTTQKTTKKTTTTKRTTTTKKTTKCTTTTTTQSVPVVFSHIEINTLPYQTTYNVGEEFNPKGLTIREVYSDKSYKIIELEKLTVTGFSSASQGEKTITVEHTYRKANYTTTFKVSIVVQDVALRKIVPFEKRGFLAERKDTYDTYGNYYDRSLCFYGEEYQRSYALYHLNGNYKRLCGTFAVEKDSFKYKSDNVIINVYADDVLVYTKDHIEKKTEPFSINLDIKNCKFLEIRVTTNYCAEILFVDAQLYLK